MQGLVEQPYCLFIISIVKSNFTQVKNRRCEIGPELKYPAKFFLCSFDITNFEKKQAEIKNRIDIAGICAELSQKMLAGARVVAVRPAGLSNSVVDLRMRWFELSGFQPAVNSFLVLAPNKKTVANIVITQRAVRLYLLCKVEHLLSQVVLVHLGISYYAVAIAWLEFAVKLLDVFEGIDCKVILACAGIVDGQRI